MEAQVAVGSLLKKLGDLLADEYARLKGVRREIRFLRSELNNMYALLQKCAAMENPDIQVTIWTKELRELAYDIEDCVDKFVHGVGTEEHHRPGGIKEFFRRCTRSLKTLGARHHIANEIQELKARVIEVSEQRNRYKLDDVARCAPSTLAIDLRRCALFVEEDHLVGIDDQRDDLVSWLLEGEDGNVKHRKVLSIYGFAGMGKSTLANAIRRKIGNQFDCEALVSVSQKPDFEKILWDILSRITKKGEFIRDLRETWDERMIIQKIREVLQQKRYFIVIDDIWSAPAWDILKCALPENYNGSRVITTTRIKSVAKACCSLPSDLCYEIEPLSEFHSRSLLFKRVFGSLDGCPVQIKYVSDDILRKCSGLPLAIVSIASILATKSNTKEQWEKVKASTGSALQKNHDLEGMKTILSLSYNDLPHYLKTCLLYLSIFPEDYDIERDSLLRRWIAEGFINEDCGQTAEDVAESYFNELINRSMILPVNIDHDGKVWVCRLHDMMLELMKSKATEENFATVIGPTGFTTKPEGVVRRISIQCNDGENNLALQEMTSLTHVRSFSIFGNYNQTLPFAYFRVLRVLSLDCQLYDVADLKIICKLHQLKYLRLIAVELPEEIGELQRLETLEWCSYSKGMVLPHGVARLQHLRHLVVDKEGMLPEGIGTMQSLQTLSRFNICDSPVSAVQEIGSLKKLRELSVSWDQTEPSDARYKKYLSSSLSELSSYSLQSVSIFSARATPVDFLESLTIHPCRLECFWMWNSYFRRSPEWIGQLDNLTKLKLDVWMIEAEDLYVLGELPALLDFQLWVVALRKEKIIIKGTGFQSLKAFSLWSGLPCLAFEQRSMPKLQVLRLMFSACGAKSYGSTHSGIEHLESLMNVQVKIYKDGARESNIEVAEREVKHAIAKHPNNLNTYIFTSGYEYFGEAMDDGDVDVQS